jgi:lysophospholipase L1-like esterase
MKLRPAPLLAALLALTAAALSTRAAEAAPAATPPPAAEKNPLAIPATDDGLPGAGPIRRFEWFQKLWLERRTNFARRTRQDQGAIVFLGDSITQGWGDGFNSLFPGVKTANRGISGDTTRGVLVRLAGDVLAVNPRGVVLLIGTNDLEEGAAPETIAANLKLILDALRAHNPAMPVILCNVFPSADAKKRPADQIKKINRLCYALLADQPQVTWVDTNAFFADAKGDAKPDEFPDLLHPNNLGYAKWEKILRPLLESTGLIAGWPDDFQPEPGFTSLFNGRDLTGWGYAGPGTLDPKVAAEDPTLRFFAKNGRLVVASARAERAYRKLWTTRKFPGDFTLRLEFRAAPNADSGIYIREPQLQCRDYLIAGPYYALKNYRPLDWNEIEITVRGGLAHCTCNGEVLVDALPVPADGPIGLESDHGQMEYRRLRVREGK